MILVDTSVWIDHLRRPDPRLQALLWEESVLCHPLVIGEVAMGSIKDRKEVLHQLTRLRRVSVARDNEVLTLVERHRFFGLGLGYVDAHLLASIQITRGSSLWTRDKRLAAAANQSSQLFDPAL